MGNIPEHNVEEVNLSLTYQSKYNFPNQNKQENVKRKRKIKRRRSSRIANLQTGELLWIYRMHVAFAAAMKNGIPLD